MPTGRTSIMVLVGAVVLSSCTGAGGGSSDFDRFSIRFREDARGYRYSFDEAPERIAEALPEVYRLLGFPGRMASSSDELLFISPSARAEGRIYDDAPNSRYLDCGTAMARPRADSHLLQFVLVTRIEPLEGGGTEIEVIVDGTAEDRTHNSNAVPCSGTGRLEGQLEALLRSMLAG